MVRRLQIVLTTLVLVLQSAFTFPSNAVWHGTSALGHKRIAPLLMSETGTYCGGSSFVYKPRIVFTVAHAFEGDDRDPSRRLDLKTIWVGYPGEVVTMNSKRIKAAKIIKPENYKPRTMFTGGRTITRENDFAIVVLEEPLPLDDKPVELLTPELLIQYLESKETVSSGGYGFQDIPDVTANCENREPMRYETQVSNPPDQSSLIRNNWNWTAPMNFLVNPGQPNQCDGDSGSGIFKDLPDKYIYLGANGAGTWNNHNCGSSPELLNVMTINASYPVFLYLKLLQEAEDFVTNNPVKVKKVKVDKRFWVTCQKGEELRVLHKLKAVCPKGFKKIAVTN